MEAAEGASGSKEELHLHCSMDEFIAQIFEQAGHSGGNGGNSGPLCAGSELAGEMAPVCNLPQPHQCCLDEQRVHIMHRGFEDVQRFAHGVFQIGCS
jgi:hypothetical protein